MTSILERPAALPSKTTKKMPLVFDNAEYAFRNADDDVREAALSASLSEDFVHDFREALSGVAVGMLEQLLKEAWLRRGRRVVFVPRKLMGSSEFKRSFPDAAYHEVWDEAVSNLPDGTVIASVAELNDQLNGYREADHDRDDF